MCVQKRHLNMLLFSYFNRLLSSLNMAKLSFYVFSVIVLIDVSFANGKIISLVTHLSKSCDISDNSGEMLQLVYSNVLINFLLVSIFIISGSFYRNLFFVSM